MTKTAPSVRARQCSSVPAAAVLAGPPTWAGYVRVSTDSAEVQP